MILLASPMGPIVDASLDAFYQLSMNSAHWAIMTLAESCGTAAGPEVTRVR
jgi:hypothetical protein